MSDPETDKSAAAVDVRVGYLSDPQDLPGLAHFTEVRPEQASAIAQPRRVG